MKEIIIKLIDSKLNHMINYITNGIKRMILDFLGRHSKNGKAAFELSYLHNRGRLPDLKHPQNLSEIWIKKVLDGEVNRIFYLADKYEVRKYVEKKGLASILTPLISVYNKTEDINFETLPNKFALKANFGAGMNIICTDKKYIDYNKVRNEVNKWLLLKHYSESERHYDLITKRIICEEFIDDGSGGFPVDYKFMCIHGHVHCILGVSGREKGHGSYLPYSIDWKPIMHYFKGNPKEVALLPKPTNLNEMIGVAERLADGIDLVRVDLYSNGSRIWFGEMTLTPSGCIFQRWSNRALEEMGKIYRNGHLR